MSEPRIITIAHGKSEIEIIKWIRSRLKMGIVIDSKKNGNESIRIENLDDWLSQKYYSDMNLLHKKFTELEYNPKLPNPMPRLKIFIIMDTEGLPVKSFKSGDMFITHPLKECIIPIFTHPNMDELFKRIGLRSRFHDKPREYLDCLDEIEPLDLYNKVKDDKNTNISEFIKYCLDTRPSNQK